MYFSYCNDTGFELFKTEQEAINSANDIIDYFRGEAADGWSDDVDSVCWGIVSQEATQVGLRKADCDDKTSCKMVCDYILK